jgi:hypothetical protein
MKINAELQGVNEVLKNTDAFVAVEKMALKEALELILKTMLDYAIQYGNYKDRTRALRGSLSINIKTMKVHKSYSEWESLIAKNREPTLRISAENYEGVISAGMWYAIMVELKSGYWVLQGAIDRFEPILNYYFQNKMRVDNLKLNQQAAITMKGLG